MPQIIYISQFEMWDSNAHPSLAAWLPSHSVSSGKYVFSLLLMMQTRISSPLLPSNALGCGGFTALSGPDSRLTQPGYVCWWQSLSLPLTYPDLQWNVGCMSLHEYVSCVHSAESRIISSISYWGGPHRDSKYSTHFNRVSRSRCCRSVRCSALFCEIWFPDHLSSYLRRLNASFGAHYHVGFPAMIRCVL